ncbi:MAG: RtcB family protein, partial [Cyanobacteria bacterium NC_groundwater_1444_Ag_S-0.65um_54_12]|nr:RtcB family protein [Cyanobacteria bacterium NC_groundwater_1444_Ag_S-0.65um_54_12]
MSTANGASPLAALERISPFLCRIPRSFRPDMRVPAEIFISESLLASIAGDLSLWQCVNVATLPGIVRAAIAMPDIHQGYGFPI